MRKRREKMLWSPKKVYQNDPFDLETDFEEAVLEVKEALFGDSRIYLDIKKKIGAKGKIKNIPDGYLIDLSSDKEPRLYVVENELAKHDPLKHIASQILEFSLSFETSPLKVKSIVRDGLNKEKDALNQCESYAKANGFENMDYLLEKMIYRDDAFNALVIIDEMPDELETVLISKFRFPVEIITLRRYSGPKGEILYEFQPFMYEIADIAAGKETIDPSEIDTIVVPAREDGFKEVFIGENCWYQIRIHSSMIPKIKHIAAYRVAPTSAITHVATVKSIEQYKGSNKYILTFSEPAKKIGPINLVPKGRVKPLYSSRYISLERLKKAKTLDDAF
jgi:hypothetical protein